MRVLFFGDVPHRLAGAQKSLLLSLTRIGVHGIEPVVVFPFDGIFAQACRDAGLDVRLLDSPPSMQAFNRQLLHASTFAKARVLGGELLPFSRSLVDFAHREGVSVLHFNTARGLITAGLAAGPANLPTVLHQRGVPPIGRGAWLLAQALGDVFVLVAKALLPCFAPSIRSRCRVVYNGVLTPKPMDRAAARAALVQRLSERGIVIGERSTIFASLSSPTPFKGLHHLLEAAKRAITDGLDAVFLCAGAGSDDEYERWLATQIAQSGIQERFHLLGFWRDVHGLLSGADATVLPSVDEERLRMGERTIVVRGSEGLPRAILESFAAERPVIATRVAGVEEQVDHEVDGLLVSPGNDTELTNAIIDAARRADWREGAGTEGRRVVERRFSVDAAARGLADVLHEIAANPPSRVRRLARSAQLFKDAIGQPKRA
ncbi:MAG: glycosyltransferase family 4 protein [Polyangiaceae bacterium]|nr:glycosyltransferase family 4 protein [Polyangiaceae bacterium]